jgi:Flp pilus assembly protein TadB
LSYVVIPPRLRHLAATDPGRLATEAQEPCIATSELAFLMPYSSYGLLMRLVRVRVVVVVALVDVVVVDVVLVIVVVVIVVVVIVVVGWRVVRCVEWRRRGR